MQCYFCSVIECQTSLNLFFYVMRKTPVLIFSLLCGVVLCSSVSSCRVNRQSAAEVRTSTDIGANAGVHIVGRRVDSMLCAANWQFDSLTVKASFDSLTRLPSLRLTASRAIAETKSRKVSVSSDSVFDTLSVRKFSHSDVSVDEDTHVSATSVPSVLIAVLSAIVCLIFIHNRLK